MVGAVILVVLALVLGVTMFVAFHILAHGPEEEIFEDTFTDATQRLKALHTPYIPSSDQSIPAVDLPQGIPTSVTYTVEYEPWYTDDPNPKVPQLWYSEEGDFLRILYPNGYVEVFMDLTLKQWEESSCSTNDYPKSLELLRLADTIFIANIQGEKPARVPSKNRRKKNRKTGVPSK